MLVSPALPLGVAFDLSFPFRRIWSLNLFKDLIGITEPGGPPWRLRVQPLLFWWLWTSHHPFLGLLFNCEAGIIAPILLFRLNRHHFIQIISSEAIWGKTQPCVFRYVSTSKPGTLARRQGASGWLLGSQLMSSLVAHQCPPLASAALTQWSHAWNCQTVPPVGLWASIRPRFVLLSLCFWNLTY